MYTWLQIAILTNKAASFGEIWVIDFHNAGSHITRAVFTECGDAGSTQERAVHVNRQLHLLSIQVH